MSSDTAITIEGVSKCYRVYDQPIDRLKEALSRHRRTYHRQVWAINDVSFGVPRGSSLGLIGRNGAGKSTLLQIIVGTVPPTSGRVTTSGRISAMLELGAGFNTEFTGRENAYLSGAIAGIGRREMNERFEEIAAFAEIGRFIDEPVKTYSSGMYARLAFAVAIHVEPDILVVDEILAVGDLPFQQRCVSKLREMKEHGLTLLFVSHSIDAIRSVCDKAVLLEEGKMLYYGRSEEAVNQYLQLVREQMNRDQIRPKESWIAEPEPLHNEMGTTRYGTGHVQIQSAELLGEDGSRRRAFAFGEEITLRVAGQAYRDIDHVSVSFLIRDVTGIDLTGTTTFDERTEIPPLRSGQTFAVQFRFKNVLRIGSFGVSVACHRVSQRNYNDNVALDHVDAAAAFEVICDPNRPVHYKFDCNCRAEVTTFGVGTQ